MEQSEQAIIFDNVSLELEGRAVLRGINLSLTEKRIALIGANGSGKSAFMRLINGLLLPSQGTVSVCGLDTARAGAAVRRKAGFMFQNPDMQIIMPTAAEDIGFGLHNLGFNKTEITTQVEKIIAEYGLEPYAAANPRSLSGGQKQILALCGVLVMEPEIILFDEPTNQLDLRRKNRFAALLKSLPQQLILATHDLSLAAECERVLVLNKGQIVHNGTAPDSISFYCALMAEEL